MEDVKKLREEAAKNLDPDDPEQAEMREAILSGEIPVMQDGWLNAAAPGLVVPLLSGNEEVSLENLDPDGVVRFWLPGRRPLVSVDRGAGPRPVPVNLDTLVIDGDERLVTLLWRGVTRYSGPKEMARWPRENVSIEDLDMVDYRDRVAHIEKAAAGRTLLIDEADIADAEAGRAAPAAPAVTSAPAPERGTQVLPAGGEPVRQSDVDIVEPAPSAPRVKPEEDRLTKSIEAADRGEELAVPDFDKPPGDKP
jgi:hypothetical protein